MYISVTFADFPDDEYVIYNAAQQMAQYVVGTPFIRRIPFLHPVHCDKNSPCRATVSLLL